MLQETYNPLGLPHATQSVERLEWIVGDPGDPEGWWLRHWQSAEFIATQQRPLFRVLEKPISQLQNRPGICESLQWVTIFITITFEIARWCWFFMVFPSKHVGTLGLERMRACATENACSYKCPPTIQFQSVYYIYIFIFNYLYENIYSIRNV